jgi:Cd2+/Zn2+-exporting ATPase
MPSTALRPGATQPKVTCAVCELHAEAVFRVEGMDCHEEVVILERRLKPLAGLESLSADVIGQRLHVQYDAARLTTADMVDAVGQTGMRMWLEHDEPRASGPDVRARFWLTVAAGVALAAGMTAAALDLTLASVSSFVAGALVGGIYPARRAVTAIRTRTVDINVLMVIAVAGALALGEWMEASSVVFLFALAQWLEARTLERARQAIRALVDLTPRDAIVKRGAVEQREPVDAIAVGDIVIVRPGDKVPLDGRIVAGRSDINEAPMTGESLPVDKEPGDEAYAGTINGRGALELEVLRVGPDTRLARIIHLVEAAQARRAPVQSFVDRFARIYTPAVIVLAILVAAVPPLLASADAATWLYRSLVLLVISCPCALVISTPVSIVSALSAAARNGVLIKGGSHLERLAGVRVIAFDKTGTLTRGEPAISEVIAVGSASSADVMRFAAAIEARSEHPIARAIAVHARHLGIDVPEAGAFMSLPGRGVEGTVAGRAVLVGNLALMTSRSVAMPSDQASFRRDGQTLVFVAVEHVLLGAIAVADSMRETAAETLELLRSHGVRRVVMLTGDRHESAEAVARTLALDECHAGLLPQQKHDRVLALRAGYGAILMVGDGVNDAPALAAADVGVAMGAAGSDAALETADIALMSDELLKIPYALRLARATLFNVKTNVVVSLVLKAAFLIMAITGSATLWMAVLADTGASVVVVANALRLLRQR